MIRAPFNRHCNLRVAGALGVALRLGAAEHGPCLDGASPAGTIRRGGLLMENATGEWLAALILDHLDLLAAEATATALAQVPWYQTFPPAAVREMFRESYRALAQVFPTHDITPMRNYVEEVITERLRSGAPAEGLIAVATILEDEIHRLIERDSRDNPRRGADAARQLMAVTKNMRMIMSGINLRLLTERAPEPRRSDPG